MTTFYQALLIGTTSIEADIILKLARSVDKSAYIQSTFTLVYRDPKVMEVIYGRKATPPDSSSPGGATSPDPATVG